MPILGSTRPSALSKVKLTDDYSLSFISWGFENAEISNIYGVMKTSLDPNFRLPFQSLNPRAHSRGIPVIQPYPTLININVSSMDLAYFFRKMSPVLILTSIVFENL